MLEEKTTKKEDRTIDRLFSRFDIMYVTKHLYTIYDIRYNMETKKCLACGHEWIIRKIDGAKKCPRCQKKLEG